MMALGSLEEEPVRAVAVGAGTETVAVGTLDGRAERAAAQA